MAIDVRLFGDVDPGSWESACGSWQSGPVHVKWGCESWHLHGLDSAWIHFNCSVGPRYDSSARDGQRRCLALEHNVTGLASSPTASFAAAFSSQRLPTTTNLRWLRVFGFCAAIEIPPLPSSPVVSSRHPTSIRTEYLGRDSVQPYCPLFTENRRPQHRRNRRYRSRVPPTRPAAQHGSETSAHVDGGDVGRGAEGSACSA